LSESSIGLPTLTPGDQRDWSSAALWPQSITYSRSACGVRQGIVSQPPAAAASSRATSSLEAGMRVSLRKAAL
jgi:hypothetical protein